MDNAALQALARRRAEAWLRKQGMTLEEYRALHFHRGAAHMRLKDVMDMWCSLWFWPPNAAPPPSRHQLMGLQAMMLLNPFDPDPSLIRAMAGAAAGVLEEQGQPIPPWLDDICQD